MNAEQLANKLNGIEYGDRILPEDIQFAKDNNLVIVTGYSDDNVEFEGAIYDEVSAYDGTTVAIDQDGIIEECDEACDHCPQEQKIEKATNKIVAEWDSNGYSWFIKAEGNIKPYYFDVLEDGEKFCRGLVFSLNDISVEK